MQRAERWNSIEERQNLLLSRTHRCDVLLHIVLTAGAFSSHCFILFSEEANIGLFSTQQLGPGCICTLKKLSVLLNGPRNLKKAGDGLSGGITFYPITQTFTSNKFNANVYNVWVQTLLIL